jgi:redox-sensitive bicupin YhaK (pirin superfamily)
LLFARGAAEIISMIDIRRSDDRAFADRGWLRSRATFAFGDFKDPRFAGFRALRVLNEERIEPGKGFGPHSHRDMEILTYMIEGRLAHRDSLTGPHVLGIHELQAMSAGDGIVHSEFNASDVELAHLLQIWIEPRAEDLTPSYQQIGFAMDDARGRLHLLAAPDSPDVTRTAVINQDARVFVAVVSPGDRVDHLLSDGRHAWIQVARGAIALNGQQLQQGDGAAISGEASLNISGDGEFLLFDLP